METIVILIMLLVGLSFLLKLTFMKPAAAVAEAVILAAAAVMMTDVAAMQSKTQIAGWLRSPELMLDVAVILTIDVAVQIAFCFAADSKSRRLSERILRPALLYFPGLLIFPTMFYLLTAMLFSFTGADFSTIGYGLGAVIAVASPTLALGLKALLPDRFSRLELIFYLNCIVAMLGVVATVNGRPQVVV